MSEEVVEVAELSAPEQVATVAPESVDSSPETPVEAPKTFSQEELDAAIGKRLAREQRKWERDQAQRQVERQVATAPVNLPSSDQFESPEDYAEALVYKRAEELISKREAQKQQSELIEAYRDREEDARNKYDDFEQVAHNPSVRITGVMAETIQSSEIGPEVAYYLGSNPKEADRISRLTPFSQAKEIGKVEAKLMADPPTKRTSSAPAPISPVSARASGSPAMDTTDPRSIKTMTASQWIEADRARQMKKMDAQRLR